MEPEPRVPLDARAAVSEGIAGFVDFEEVLIVAGPKSNQDLVLDAWHKYESYQVALGWFGLM